MHGIDEALLVLNSREKVRPKDPFAPVRMVQLSVAGNPVPRWAIMADEAGEEVFIASHSENYSLVHNETMAQVFMDAVTRAGIKSLEFCETVWDGKKFAMRAFSEVGFEINGGGALRLGIEAINSYDGSSLFGIRFFAFKAACRNQFHFRNQLGGFTFKHSGSAYDLEDAVNQVQNGAKRFTQLLPVINRLRSSPATLDSLLAWHKKLLEAKPSWPDSKTGDVLKRFRDEEKTAWGLLNAFTFVTTNEIRGFSGSKYSELVCRVAEEA